MRKIITILLLLVVWLIAGAPGCGDERIREMDRQAIAKVNGSIRQQIGTDELSDESLRAFGISAMQKVRDFADYWSVLCDSSADKAFRLQAAKLVRSLFVHNSVLITVPGMDESCARRSLKQTLESIISEKCQCSGFKPDTIFIQTPFVRMNDSLYECAIRMLVRKNFTGGA